MRRGDLERTIAEGVAQTADYLDRCAAEAGHPVIFDRDQDRSWDQKVFHDRRQADAGPTLRYGDVNARERCRHAPPRRIQ